MASQDVEEGVVVKQSLAKTGNSHEYICAPARNGMAATLTPLRGGFDITSASLCAWPLYRLGSVSTSVENVKLTFCDGLLYCHLASTAQFGSIDDFSLG